MSDLPGVLAQGRKEMEKKTARQSGPKVCMVSKTSLKKILLSAMMASWNIDQGQKDTKNHPEWVVLQFVKIKLLGDQA